MAKPEVYITRKIPVEVLSYLAGHFSYELWPEEDTPVPRQGLLEKARSVQALYTLLTDRIDEEVFRAAPELKVVATACPTWWSCPISADRP